MMSTASSARLPRVRKSAPISSNSSSIQPTPMPRATRLPISDVIEASCLATPSGWRSGST